MAERLSTHTSDPYPSKFKLEAPICVLRYVNTEDISLALVDESERIWKRTSMSYICPLNVYCQNYDLLFSETRLRAYRQRLSLDRSVPRGTFLIMYVDRPASQLLGGS